MTELVANEIADGLWQVAQRHRPETWPDVDIVFWFSSTAPPSFSVPVVHLPFPDSADGVAPAYLLDVLRGMASATAHLRVCSVCDEGKNRSGLFSALSLIARGMSAHDAVETVRAKGSSPGTVRALSNPGFLRQLGVT